jgi:hypothetical protein
MQNEDDGDTPATQAKRRYRKPEVTRVPLKPEEAVLGACKSAGVGGPVDSDCMNLGCSSIGS